MRVCLACHQPVGSADWNCANCGHSPPKRDGILLFSPELADASSGFEARYFPKLASKEAEHFWFRARNRLIIWAFKKYFPQAENFLEIGCGTGFVLSGLKNALPQLRICGSEIFSEGLSFAAQRLPQAELWQMDARHLPFKEEFDVIGAFDVVEHIEEDEKVLSELYHAVKPGGGILLTVPQHAWLWSEADETAHHVRRYERAELKQKVEQAGFEILGVTSFVSLLLPAMWLSRSKKKSGSHSPTPEDPTESAEFNIPPLINQSFEALMALERGFIQSGISFPAGGSLLLTAKKRCNETFEKVCIDSAREGQ